MKNSVLVDREDILKTIEEEQHLFIRDILIKIGLQVQDCFPSSIEEFTVENKIEFRKLLFKYNVNIQSIEKKLSIIIDKENVAIMEEPDITLKSDIDSSSIYAEIIFNSWSMFEDQK